jgi:ABC-type sugar transport system permease subunit
LPSVRNVILIISLISTIWTFSEFDVIFLLTGGGPGSATEVLPILTYVTAFRRYDLGQAAAIAVLTVPVFLALIIWLVRLVVGKEEG